MVQFAGPCVGSRRSGGDIRLSKSGWRGPGAPKKVGPPPIGRFGAGEGVGNADLLGFSRGWGWKRKLEDCFGRDLGRRWLRLESSLQAVWALVEKAHRSTSVTVYRPGSGIPHVVRVSRHGRSLEGHGEEDCRKKAQKGMRPSWPEARWELCVLYSFFLCLLSFFVANVIGDAMAGGVSRRTSLGCSATPNGKTA